MLKKRIPKSKRGIWSQLSEEAPPGNIPPDIIERFNSTYDAADEAKDKKDYRGAARLYGRAVNLARMSLIVYILRGGGYLLGTDYIEKETRKDTIRKRDEMRRLVKERDITQKLSVIIAIGGLALAIFFLSFNLTGNTISDLSAKTTSFIGVGLLIVGLVAGFFWVKSRGH